jgi:hypothetical protein
MLAPERLARWLNCGGHYIRGRAIKSLLVPHRLRAGAEERDGAETVRFRRMADGTRADYELLARHKRPSSRVPPIGSWRICSGWTTVSAATRSRAWSIRSYLFSGVERVLG